MSQTKHEFSASLRLEVFSRYLLYLPEDHSERSDWPLIVFLHGSGERGDDLTLVEKHGLPRLLGAGLRLPAVVISPQCPAGQLWTPQLPAIKALVDDAVASRGVDPTRIVATGLSLGGAGAYELVSRYPGTFAGVAPICGPWTSLFVTDESASLPTWVFHGDADDVVPLSDSEDLVRAIEAKGGSPRFTVYPGVGHNSWDAAYGDPELLEWLVEQQRA